MDDIKAHQVYNSKDVVLDDTAAPLARNTKDIALEDTAAPQVYNSKDVALDENINENDHYLNKLYVVYDSNIVYECIIIIKQIIFNILNTFLK